MAANNCPNLIQVISRTDWTGNPDDQPYTHAFVGNGPTYTMWGVLEFGVNEYSDSPDGTIDRLSELVETLAGAESGYLAIETVEPVLGDYDYFEVGYRISPEHSPDRWQLILEAAEKPDEDFRRDTLRVVLSTRQELSDELLASEIDAMLSPLPCTPAVGNVDPTFETAGGVVLCDR